MANPDDEKPTLDSALTKPDEQAEQSVPTWQELPEYAQTDLAPCGYDAAWFAAARAKLLVA